MSTEPSVDRLVEQVSRLRRLPREITWVEFKENNDDPREIGEYISALANSAALAGEDSAYLVWGIADGDHTVAGTSFRPYLAKKGGENLENWLVRQLVPEVRFHFFQVSVDGLPIVMLQIERALHQPVQFEGQKFIRIGSYKKLLKDFPETERDLWRVFDHAPFESGAAIEPVPGDAVLQLLDCAAYYELLPDRPRPADKERVLESLESDRLVIQSETGNWTITNLGAVLFAKDLAAFPSLRGKMLRVVQYCDNTRTTRIGERTFAGGYACMFEDLINFISGLLPSQTAIQDGGGVSVPVFPVVVLRELLANALVHQDFFTTGRNPMVEIFDNRLEIMNPGLPLVDVQRFVDTPPKSRNDALAALMRQIGICQQLGSGWDRVVSETELHHLPAPLVETGDDYTRVVLFAPRAFSEMDRRDRTRAVYYHACLLYVNRGYVTNASVRTRFGLEPTRTATGSRLLKDAVTAGAIAPYDAGGPRNRMRYVPFWAVPQGHQDTPWVTDRTSPPRGLNP